MFLLSAKLLNAWRHALDWERKLGLEEGEFLYPHFMISRYLDSFEGHGKRSIRAARERAKADREFLKRCLVEKLAERGETFASTEGWGQLGKGAYALLRWWRNTLQEAGIKWYPVSVDVLPVCTGRALQRLTDDAVIQWVLAQPGLKRTGRLEILEPALQPRRSPSTDWEVLPPEWLASAVRVAHPVHGGESSPGAERAERLELLASLLPARWYQGKGLRARNYVVADYDGIVVADCNRYGNALYIVIGGGWQEILRTPKRVARSLGARRIIHDPDGRWKRRVRTLVRRFRGLRLDGGA